MAGKAYLTRMGIGFPGAVTRPQDLTAEPAILDATKPFPSYGLAGKNLNGKFVPLEAGDTVADVAGLFVRPYPTTNPTDARALGVTAGYTGDQLKRGYICVAVLRLRPVLPRRVTRFTSVSLRLRRQVL